MFIPLILNVLGAGFQSVRARVQSPVGGPTIYVVSKRRAWCPESTDDVALSGNEYPDQLCAFSSEKERQYACQKRNYWRSEVKFLEGAPYQPRVVPSGGFPA